MAETTAERAARIAQEMADKPTTDRQLEQERVAAEAAADRDAQLLSGNYGEADRFNPVLYGGGSYSGGSTLKQATQTDLNRFKDDKGYAVYDSFTDADGAQYVAVSGKNSSFIEKINTDGTIERIDNVSRKRDKKSTNIKRVLGAFDDLKSSLNVDDYKI